MRPNEPVTGCSMAAGGDVVEVHLLSPARQLRALEAAAARSQVTVAALLRDTIDDLLRVPAGGGSAAP